MYQFNIEFEYDQGKSEANLLKHGLCLEEAKLLWVSEGTETKSFYPMEDRWLRIGILNEKFYTCVFTYREKKIRLISLRRSCRSEIELYWRTQK